MNKDVYEAGDDLSKSEIISDTENKQPKELSIDIINKLNKLRLPHNECEDQWYSCPKSEFGCANDNVGDKCNCGADEYNKILDGVIIDIHNSIKPKSKSCDCWKCTGLEKDPYEDE